MIRLTPHCRIVRMRGVVRNNGALCWLVNAETMMRVEEPLGNSGRLGSRAVAQFYRDGRKTFPFSRRNFSAVHFSDFARCCSGMAVYRGEVEVCRSAIEPRRWSLECFRTGNSGCGTGMAERRCSHEHHRAFLEVRRCLVERLRNGIEGHRNPVEGHRNCFERLGSAFYKGVYAKPTP